MGSGSRRPRSSRSRPASAASRSPGMSLSRRPRKSPRQPTEACSLRTPKSARYIQTLPAPAQRQRSGTEARTQSGLSAQEPTLPASDPELGPERRDETRYRLNEHNLPDPISERPHPEACARRQDARRRSGTARSIPPGFRESPSPSPRRSLQPPCCFFP